MTLLDALFPTVAVRLPRAITYASGKLFAPAGASVLAHGLVRGGANEVEVTYHGAHFFCRVAELDGAEVLDEIPL